MASIGHVWCGFSPIPCGVGRKRGAPAARCLSAEDLATALPPTVLSFCSVDGSQSGVAYRPPRGVRSPHSQVGPCRRTAACLASVTAGRPHNIQCDIKTELTANSVVAQRGRMKGFDGVSLVSVASMGVGRYVGRFTTPVRGTVSI